MASKILRNQIKTTLPFWYGACVCSLAAAEVISEATKMEELFFIALIFVLLAPHV
jgi:hypothetical protein